jgi:HK97 family phage portal protein
MIYEIFGTAPNTISGQSINPASALRVPAVRLAVTLIAEKVGALPFKAYEQNGDEKTVARDHPAYRLIHDWANEDQSAEEFRALLTADALLHDNGFAFVNAVDGRPVELNRLDPERVTIQTDDRTGRPIYIYQPDKGARRIYTADEILRIRCPGGCSPIKHGRETIALCLVLEQHAAKLFGAGARPSGLLMTEKSLGDEAKGKIGNAWTTKFGPGGPGGTAILDENMKFAPLTLNSTDAQFLEMRRFQIQEIARLFGVPVTLLGDLSNGIKSNVEQQALAFLTDTLSPWLYSWSRAYERALFPTEERPLYRVEAVVDGLMAADTAAKFTAIREGRSSGVITANDARRLLNLPALPDGDRLENPYVQSGKSLSVGKSEDDSE